MSVQWPEKVIFCEVGPRDGLQNEPSTLAVERKIALIEGVADAGVKIVEVGSFVHPKAVPQMADTDEVARTFRRVEGVNTGPSWQTSREWSAPSPRGSPR